MAGFLLDVPRLFILNETIRNLYFHVCMWFGMMILFGTSFVYSIKYLRGFDYRNDIFAVHFASVGSLFGILGYLTGTIWVSVTWVTDQGQSFGAVPRTETDRSCHSPADLWRLFRFKGSFTDMDKKPGKRRV